MKLLYKYITLALFSFLLTSCGTTLKTYQRETPYNLTQYRNAKILADSSSIATLNWKSFFKDSLLIHYIDTALINNLDMLRAQQNLIITQSLIKQSKANFLPSINGTFSATRSHPSNKSFNGANLPDKTTFNDFSLGASFSWEMDVWGKINSQKKASLAQYYQTENVKRLIQSQIINAVANNYYLLQSLDAQKEILLETIKNRKESITTTKALKKSGNVTEVAVKQTEAQLYDSQAILLDVENKTTITENALSILLGKAPKNIHRNKLSTELSTPDEFIKTGFPIQVLDNRPDILAAEYNLMYSVELTNIAKASMYPSITISGSGGLNSQNFSELFNINTVFGNIAAGLLQPIFNHRKLKTQKEVRLHEQQIALLDYKENVLTAYQEIANELTNLATSKKKLLIKEKEKQALLKSLEYSEDLLAQGFVNYIEILRAKDIVLNAQLEIINLKLTQLTSKTNLYRALGGGWK
ncbi:efflux transporter outer membrane subunit [Tenacibaculum sp. UWU-22]|uniref:efflux transporter outer membrane subunit n=1 Tax=Tenacibaculum sp. UWU-22 TaxID=3234187 RepID=UPI0034DB0A4A